MEPGLFWKQKVLPNSTFRAKVSPTTLPDVWTAELFLRTNDGQMVAHFSDAQLRAGTPPLVLKGKKPARYWGQLVVTFAGPTSALVELDVIKPDGKTPHGEPYKVTHNDAPADSVALAIFMA